MADSNSWVVRTTAQSRQDGDVFLDVLEVDALPPAHAGSRASPLLAGQFRRWLAEGDEGDAPSPEPDQPRLGFKLSADSTLGERIIACFADRPGPVVIGQPDPGGE